MAALFIPLSLNYILASFSSSAENVLIPRTLKLYGLSPALALDIFGTISGLTLPVLLFPGVLCRCACVMLLPSVSEANAAGKDAKITKTIKLLCLIRTMLWSYLYMHILSAVGFYRGFSFFIQALWIFS